MGSPPGPVAGGAPRVSTREHNDARRARGCLWTSGALFRLCLDYFEMCAGLFATGPRDPPHPAASMRPNLHIYQNSRCRSRLRGPGPPFSEQRNAHAIQLTLHFFGMQTLRHSPLSSPTAPTRTHGTSAVQLSHLTGLGCDSSQI